MAYRIQEGEGVADAIRRVVAEELDNAVAQLEGRADPDRDAAVHDARKSLKKARSALRLGRYDLDGDVRAAANAVMRDAGRRLSGVRDAQVLLQTLAKVAGEERLGAPPAGVAALREALEDRREALRAQMDDDGGAASAAARDLRELRERVSAWPPGAPGFGRAARGLARIAGQGRAAMDEALGPGADDEAWHEWRKGVKDLWYALRLLEPTAARQLGAMVAEADELSDVLGDHNDLAVLATAARHHAGALEDADAAGLSLAVRRRATELRLQAIPLGARLYAETPKAFVRRVCGLWAAREAEAAVGRHAA